MNKKEALALLAVATYKPKRVNDTMAGRILGVGEYEFYRLLSKYSFAVNYNINNLRDDIETLKSLD